MALTSRVTRTMAITLSSVWGLGFQFEQMPVEPEAQSNRPPL